MLNGARPRQPSLHNRYAPRTLIAAGPQGTPTEVYVMLNGGCFCGWIRYEADGAPFDETSCHCSICRRTTGAPFVAWFTVARSRYRLLKGEPAQFRSTPKATRSFCPRCGTQLTFAHDELPDEIDITTCSLDDPDVLPPHDHTRTSSRLGWVRLCDGLPQYPEGREHDPGAPG